MRAVVSYAVGTFLALALVSGLGVLLVAAVGGMIEIYGEYRQEQDNCLRGATNGLEIRRCTEGQ